MSHSGSGIKIIKLIIDNHNYTKEHFKLKIIMNAIAKSTLSSIIADSIKDIARQSSAVDIIKKEMKARVDNIKKELIKAIVELDSEEVIEEVAEVAIQECQYEIETTNIVKDIMSAHKHLEPICLFRQFSTFDQKLEYLKLYDLGEEVELSSVLSWFNIEKQEEADKVAAIYMKQLGPIVVCNNCTYSNESFHTIMDCIDCDGETLIFSLAFSQLGFKYAHDCDTRILANMYVSYGKDLTDIEELYDLENIKKSNKWLNIELQHYLFHPNRIQKWIEQGYDIEDYMN